MHQAARAFNNHALQRLHTRGHQHLSMAHTGLLPYLDVEGTRATVLAERAGMTKQAVGQLIVDLERHGYVERQPDPHDRRATLIRFTRLGWQYLLDAQEVKGEIEAAYAAVLGNENLAMLRAALTALVERATTNTLRGVSNTSEDNLGGASS